MGTNEASDLELQFRHALERLDLVRELVRHMNDFSTSYENELMWLALRGLIGSDFEIRKDLMPKILAWEFSPAQGLDELDRLGGRHPAFTSLLRDLVGRYADERGMDRDPPEDDRLVDLLREEAGLLHSLNRFKNSAFVYCDATAEVRRQLLHICLREGVRLRQVVEALRGMSLSTIDRVDSLCDSLHDDAPLNAVSDGCLALWHT